ncbi:MFS family (AraJ) [Fructobacillus cardui]|uniref:MFS transporter n=1 Tax=Fructobacillus cardui TaxID=2893170 RepID=UPI002D943809|nr:MFS family (AraJ) [Fructobacillus cardui]
MLGISTVSGPLIGGILSESFGWPSIFYVNIPIGILAGILVYFTTKETPKYGEGQKIDFWGMILSSTAIFSAVYGLIQKENYAQLSWLNPQIAFWLIAAVLLLLAFIIVESRIEKPMMDLSLFKNKNFVGSIIVAFVLGSGVYAMQIFITSMMENALSYAAFETGLRQVPITIWSLILGPVAGYLTNKFSNRRTIAINLLVGAVGLLLFANAITTRLSYQELILPLILLGVSNGLVNPLLNNAALADAKPDEIGMVSGLVNVFMQLGTSFGVVILGLSQSKAYDSHLHTFFNSLDVHLPSIEKIKNQLLAEGPFSSHSIMLQDINAPMAIVKSVQHAALKAFYAGMNSVMLVSASILTVAAVLAFFLLKDGQAAKNLENN